MVLLNLQLVVDWMVLVKHGLKPSSAVLKCKNVLFVSYLIAMKDPEINCELIMFLQLVPNPLLLYLFMSSFVS